MDRFAQIRHDYLKDKHPDRFKALKESGDRIGEGLSIPGVGPCPYDTNSIGFLGGT